MFRRRGFATYLTGIPWSEDFMRRYASALEGVKAQPAVVGSTRTIAGSFDALIVCYYRSPEFHSLKATTQRVRRNQIESFRKEHGTKPVALLNRTHIKNMIGAKAETPEAANNLLKLLRLLLAFAIEQGMVESNQAVGVKRYKSREEGFHTWTEAEVAQFESRHPDGSKARLMLALALYTAQRVSDVVRMGWQHVQGDRIAVRQEKTDTALSLKMHPELIRVLAVRAQDQPHVPADTHMASRSPPQGMSNWFGKRCREAGLPHCSAHGLRNWRQRGWLTLARPTSTSRATPDTRPTKRLSATPKLRTNRA